MDTFETFTPQERAALAPHVTNLDGPVFALTDLPEVVKGALFARYSRSAKSLRRLFLDEFSQGSPDQGSVSVTEGGDVDVERAEALYERMFLDYGDDSVAQLGGVHLACEQASQLLAKVLERGRLAAYLEQSTRYVPFDDRPGGRWRYHVPAEVRAAGPELAGRYRGALDEAFATYARWLPPMQAFFRERFPQRPGRLGLRLPDDDPGQGVRHAPWSAARGHPDQRGYLRLRPGLREPPAADAGLRAGGGPGLRRPDADRAPQGDPRVPAQGRRSRTGRGMVALPGRDPGRHASRRPGRRSPARRPSRVRR